MLTAVSVGVSSRPRFLPRKALPGVLEEPAHDIEESHHQHGLTDAVSVETHDLAPVDGSGR